MRDEHTVTAWVRLRKAAILAFAGVTFLAGALLLAIVVRGRAPGDLTWQDRTEIGAVVGREVAGPVGALTPNRDGTVQVFVGSGGQLGGQLVQVARHKGSWRVVQRTLLY